MAVQDSIRRALENGVSFSIVRSGESDIEGEYLLYDTSILSSRDFQKEHILEAMLASDTEVIAGELLSTSDGRNFLVAHLTPEMYRDDVLYYEANIFKCNFSSGTILRPSGEDVWDASYHKTTSWLEKRSGLRGLLTEATIAAPSDLSDQDEFGQILTTKKTLFLQSGEDLQILDRISPKSGEYFKVNTINKWIYPGLLVASVSEDTR